MPKVETIKFLPPEVKKDEEVTEPPPTIEEVKEAVISNKTQEGEKGDETAVVAEAPPAPIEVPKEEEIVTYAEQMPSFPGGYKEMMLFIQKNVVYPKEASSMGIEGKVFIGFVVDQQGNLSNFTVTKGIGYGCDEAALNVVKKMPKWEAAKMNGRPVKIRISMPITFKLN
jgi:protein TonB